MPAQFPKPLLGLIPHRPPMLAVDRLISLTENEAVTETVFSPGSIFAKNDGHIEEATLFEMIAQAFAAAMAAGGQKAGAGAGYLVGLKRVKFHGAALAGLSVTVRSKVISQVDDFFVVEGEVRQDGRLLASGQITVFVPGEAL
jgi:predicted hotdog family 3-hydroxylacyl-ACP dehydratase